MDKSHDHHETQDITLTKLNSCQLLYIYAHTLLPVDIYTKFVWVWIGGCKLAVQTAQQHTHTSGHPCHSAPPSIEVYQMHNPLHEGREGCTQYNKYYNGLHNSLQCILLYCTDLTLFEHHTVRGHTRPYASLFHPVRLSPSVNL